MAEDESGESSLVGRCILCIVWVMMLIYMLCVLSCLAYSSCGPGMQLYHLCLTSDSTLFWWWMSSLYAVLLYYIFQWRWPLTSINTYVQVQDVTSNGSVLEQEKRMMSETCWNQQMSKDCTYCFFYPGQSPRFSKITLRASSCSDH